MAGPRRLAGHRPGFLPVALSKAKARADREGMTLTLQVADAATADLGDASFELVIVLYLHLPRTDMAGVFRRCQRAVITSGTVHSTSVHTTVSTLASGKSSACVGLSRTATEGPA